MYFNIYYSFNVLTIIIRSFARAVFLYEKTPPFAGSRVSSPWPCVPVRGATGFHPPCPRAHVPRLSCPASTRATGFIPVVRRRSVSSTAAADHDCFANAQERARPPP